MARPPVMCLLPFLLFDFRQGILDVMELDHQLCYCFHVTKRKIVNFVKQTQPQRASQISQCFGAGSGCGWCIPFLIKIHRQVVGGEAVLEDQISPEEYAALRLKYHQNLKDGACTKNSYEAPSSGAASKVSAGAAPREDVERRPDASDASVPPAKEAAFDYTRYFSRSRPDPEPETLE